MSKAGPLQLSIGTLDLCLCVGSAQWVAVELLPLQWTAAAAGCLWAAAAAGCLWAAAVSLPQRVAAS